MIKALVVFSICFFAVGGVSAKTAKDCHRELKESCKKKRGKARFECMREKATSMDAECQKVIQEAKEEFQSGGGEHPCKLDRDKCKDDGSGPEKVMKCLQDRRAELSDSCKKFLDDRISKMPCHDEKQKFCKDVKPGDGRIANCLKAKEAELSPECKEKIKSSKGELDSAPGL